MMPVYLDYAATTPVDPAVAAAMAPWASDAIRQPAFAAPLGLRGRRRGRRRPRRRSPDCSASRPSTIAFTGGATEAVNWALKGVMLAAAAGAPAAGDAGHRA